MQTSLERPTAAGVRRQIRAWARSVDVDVLPEVPGASSAELRELAALGGIAAVLGHQEASSWPDAVVRWAFHAPRPPQTLLDLVDRAFSAGLDPLAEAYNTAISATNRRRLGTVFTPDDVVEHMLDLVDAQLGDREPAVIVDPGAGVGAFTLAAARRWPAARIVAVDVNPVTLGLLAARIARERTTDAVLRGANIDLRLADYLDELPQLFGPFADGPVVALGNPPYTRTQALTADYKRKAAALAGDMVSSGHANLAMLFQAATFAHLRDGDLSCMVLPASLMYTRAARDIRAAIWRSDRPVIVHRWPAKARAFIGRNVQAAVLVLGPSRTDPGPIRLARVETAGADVEEIETWSLERHLQQPPDSWYSALPAGDLGAGGVALGDIAKVRRGVATGANSVFFLGDDLARTLPREALVAAVPTLRAFFGTELGEAAHDELGRAGQRRWLLALRPDSPLDAATSKYLAAHEDVANGYLCSQRERWWAISDLPRPAVLVSPLSKTDFKVVLNTAGAVPSNNLLGINLAADMAPALADWLRGPDGQAELRRVSRRYQGGSHKVEPGDLRRVRVPETLAREVQQEERDADDVS